MKLFSKNSNIYDHDTSTLQTDGQTTCLGNTALCYASSGKNSLSIFLLYLISYTGCPLSGASSSRSPALPIQNCIYYLASLPLLIAETSVTFHLEPCVHLTELFFVPHVCTCFGSRSFDDAAPAIWNSLLVAIRNSVSTHSFRRQLKTFFSVYNLGFRPP